MKKSMMMMLMVLTCSVSMAKDIRTVVFTTLPKMTCSNCENTIKGNLRFEKGVKSIETNIPEQAVTVKYDADKISAETLQKAFGKFGYQATQVKTEDKTCEKQQDGEKKPDCCKKK